MKTTAFLFVIALGGVSAAGQVNQSALTGTVRDTTGAAVPKTSITVRNKATSAVVKGVTDGTRALPYQWSSGRELRRAVRTCGVSN